MQKRYFNSVQQQFFSGHLNVAMAPSSLGPPICVLFTTSPQSLGPTIHFELLLPASTLGVAQVSLSPHEPPPSDSLKVKKPHWKVQCCLHFFCSLLVGNSDMLSIMPVRPSCKFPGSLLRSWPAWPSCLWRIGLGGRRSGWSSPRWMVSGGGRGERERGGGRGGMKELWTFLKRNGTSFQCQQMCWRNDWQYTIHPRKWVIYLLQYTAENTNKRKKHLRALRFAKNKQIVFSYSHFAPFNLLR